MQTNLQRPQRLFAQPIRYDIPAFQRRYVWKQEEQWEPLWDDVEQLAQSIMEEGQNRPSLHGCGRAPADAIPHGDNRAPHRC